MALTVRLGAAAGRHNVGSQQDNSLLYWSLWGLTSTALAALLVAVIWSIRRRRDVALRVRSTAGIEQSLPSLAGLALGGVVHGNSLELLENGRYFDVLLERIRAARYSVHFETFLWQAPSGADWPTRFRSRRAPACRCGCCSMRTARKI